MAKITKGLLCFFEIAIVSVDAGILGTVVDQLSYSCVDPFLKSGGALLGAICFDKLFWSRCRVRTYCSRVTSEVVLSQPWAFCPSGTLRFTLAWSGRPCTMVSTAGEYTVCMLKCGRPVQARDSN